MAITAQGLVFQPLYWIHNDCWKYIVPVGIQFITHEHWGHCHFFMLGYDWQRGNGDAFSGKQTFNFSIKDIWGPRSGDPNQQNQYVVVGLPKWYLTVTELWRRVYIQPWDEDLPIAGDGIVGRRGIKWDASQSAQTFGPFREGQGFAPLFIDSPRTLPIEYFTSDAQSRTQRDNYIKGKYLANDGLTAIPFGDGTLFDPPPNGDTPLINTPGGHATWADGLYIYPTMEYQKVVQLNDERMPGFAAKNDIDQNNFGDGWSISVTVPFTDPVTGIYRSPFGPSPGVCMPPGQYFNDVVDPKNYLMNRASDNTLPDPMVPSSLGGYDYQNRPFGLKDSQSLQPLQFQDPYNVGDGKWVQQCLGGIVTARAVVTIQSKLGGRQDVDVTTTQYLPQDQFAGTDQMEGAASES